MGVVVEIPAAIHTNSEGRAKTVQSINEGFCTHQLFHGDFIERGTKQELDEGTFVLLWERYKHRKYFKTDVTLAQVRSDGLVTLYEKKGLSGGDWVCEVGEDIAKFIAPPPLQETWSTRTKTNSYLFAALLLVGAAFLFFVVWRGVEDMLILSGLFEREPYTGRYLWGNLPLSDLAFVLAIPLMIIIIAFAKSNERVRKVMPMIDDILSALLSPFYIAPVLLALLAILALLALLVFYIFGYMR